MSTAPDVTSKFDDLVIKLDVVLTAVFGVTAAFAAISFSTAAQWVGAVTAMVLFTIGVFAFIWSYWNAVQLSRTHNIAVSQVYLLLGSAIPAKVRRVMNGLIVLQFAIAFATTLLRPNGPNGSPGSSLAVGFLVPMMGFGLNGLWAVYHGTFAERTEPSTISPAEVPTSDAEIRQNADHG